MYNDVAEIEEVPGNTRTSQEERPGSQSKSQKERSGSLVLGVFGAFAELLSDRRPLRCCSGPLRGLCKAHMGIFPAFLALFVFVCTARLRAASPRSCTKDIHLL